MQEVSIAAGALAFVAPKLQTAVTPLLPGAAFALCNIGIGYPFDTVKTRLQLKLHPNASSCLRDLAQNGLRGLRATLYRGASLPLAAHVCKQPVEFVAFEYCIAASTGGPAATYLGGLLGGCLGALIICPFSMAKIRVQASRPGTSIQPEAQPRNALFRACVALCGGGTCGKLREVLKASLAFQVPYSTAFLGTYGVLREAMPRTPLGTATAGATASLATWSIVLPLDVLRTRVQARAMQAEGPPRMSWFGELRAIIHTQGIQGLWVGWGPIAMRAVLSGISVTAYEQVRSNA